MTPLFRTLVRPSASASPAQAWEIPTLPGGEPGREAYALLGSAWRSSAARLVDTGRGFDVVRAPRPYASAALDQLREHGARRGAVAAEGDCWTFFVPPGSNDRPWPSYADYVSGPAVWVPPRSARSDDLHLRWITREPAGHLLADPHWLSALLTDPQSVSALLAEEW
ncbi:hypothetical protein [Streptomyces canus]|uniref:hypothetical protein n=1 Tax=Streptomyces canus TaxID=58343 RepID=UPI00278B9D93|nr:hypothetical protein [Streptomyces canus]MDQ0765579.1 hypothetical protein [Streptomyces canus]